MADLPRVSIIIVTWNALDVLQKCLPSVVAANYPNMEIIVADNASTDGSAAWVASAFPDTIIVRHAENGLFCKGNNEAIPHATGDYIVLLNNDVEVTPGWLEPLVHEMEAEDVGAVQPKLKQHDNRTFFEYAGAAGGFIDRVGYPFTRGRIFDTMEADYGQYDDPRDVFWATGAALMLRRSALDEVGLLDEQFEMHMEEIDLCWRLQRAGYRVRVAPDSEVYHIGGASLPKGNPRKTYYNFRNSLLMLYKNLAPADWLRVFPQRIAMDGAAMLRATAQGQMEEAAAILRAYRDAHRMKSSYNDIRPATTLVHPPYRRFIAVDYFLNDRQCFYNLPGDAFEH
jgi:hypothetical protein